MPWKVFGKCVHKVDESGNKGELVKCHESADKARAHMRALYANVEESAGDVRTSDVHELVSLTEATLDADNYTVQGARLIRAGWSENNRAYPDGVLAEAAPIFDGVKAYADHPSKSDMTNRPERSVRDIVGVYESPRHQNGATYADMRVLGEARQWLWPLIEETMNTGRPIVGLSINALGKTRKGELDGRRGIVVEAITHANSVDVVTEPAAGGGFDRLLMADDGWTKAVLDAIELDELREARPDILAALKKEWATPRDSEALAEARNTADKLQARVTELEARTAEPVDGEQVAQLTEENRTLRAELKAAQVDRLLASTRLPAKWRKGLRADLLAAKEDDWEGIVEREAEKAAAIRPPVQVHGAGRIAPPPTPDTSMQRNPVSEAFGLSDTARPNETLEEYRARKEQANIKE